MFKKKSCDGILVIMVFIILAFLLQMTTGCCKSGKMVVKGISDCDLSPCLNATRKDLLYKVVEENKQLIYENEQIAKSLNLISLELKQKIDIEDFKDTLIKNLQNKTFELEDKLRKCNIKLKGKKEALKRLNKELNSMKTDK